MALPSTGYCTASAGALGVSLFDFTLLVDLHYMDPLWWAEVNTSDGTQGRAAIDSDETELACDWIDFTGVDVGPGQSGWLRVKFTGNYTGAETIRVYPPNTANAAVLPGDLHGRHNAYDANFVTHQPCDEASGNLIDRTRNGNDATPLTPPTYGAAGQVGKGLEFDRPSGQSFTGGTTGLSAAGGTAMLWGQSDATLNAFHYALTHFNGGNRIYIMYRYERWGFQLGGSSPLGWAEVYNDHELRHIAITWDGANGNLFHDGALNIGPLAYSGLADIGSTYAIGAVNPAGSPSDHFDGILDEIQYHSVVRSADWIASEYSQSKDNSAFWGPWTWTPGGPPTVSLAADWNGVGTLTGDIDVEGPTVNLSVDWQGVGTLAADIQVNKPLATDWSGVGTLVADIAVAPADVVPLTANWSGVGSFAGDISVAPAVYVNLAADLQGVGTLTATLAYAPSDIGTIKYAIALPETNYAATAIALPSTQRYTLLPSTAKGRTLTVGI